MNTLMRALGLTILCASLTQAAPGGVISGSVKGPDGSAYKGAFVRAQSTKTKIAVNVLSDRNGAYRIQDLEPGEYQVTASRGGLQERSSQRREGRLRNMRYLWISLCRRERSDGPTFPFTKGRFSCRKAPASSCCFTDA